VSLYLTNTLKNKLYVKNYLYDLQIEESTTLLDHLIMSNMLNIYLLNFILKIKEDKTTLLLTSLSFFSLIKTILYEREVLEL
jgi:hypothetical protein